jgi:hypothetical protein
LKKEDGNWCDDWEGLGNIMMEFFQALYTRDEEVDPEVLMPLFDNRVTQEMNEQLCQEFTDEEIGDAFFQIRPLKAPGPNGFPTRFFQRNWGTMREEITMAVRESFQIGYYARWS